jgi:hypothetical protein
VVTASPASAESNSDDEKDKVGRGRDANDAIGRVLSLKNFMILEG